MAPARKQDIDRALRLLETYHNKLSSADDTALQAAIEKVIHLFRSKLFSALIDIQEYYEEILQDVSKSPEQVAQETAMIAKKWERQPNSPRSVSPDLNAVTVNYVFLLIPKLLIIHKGYPHISGDFQPLSEICIGKEPSFV